MNDPRTHRQFDPTTSAYWLPEPLVEFAGGKCHVDPKVGVALYGPRSFGTSRHRQEIHLGVIGTANDVEATIEYFTKSRDGVDGDVDHSPFPGCDLDQGYRTYLRFGAQTKEFITQNDLKGIASVPTKRERFTAVVDLVREKLVQVSDRDHPLDLILICLPLSIVKELGAVDYHDRGAQVHRDLRCALKAMAMAFETPTQLVLPSTVDSSQRRRRALEHASAIAWNFHTAIYSKVDGLPWSPHGLPHGTCFVGVSFFRPLGESSTLRTSVVQAFDENGEGLVLRGHRFHWDERKEGRSPHLPAEQAEALMKMVLQHYESNRRTPPQRVVVHKSSRYEELEAEGFQSALSTIPRTDLIAICPRSDIRLIRTGQYPPLRGTVFQAGDISFLYSVGYLEAQGRYPHGHVPSPLQLSDWRGDTEPKQLFTEILALTKMNWNAAHMHALMPITLRFSRSVGQILRECEQAERIQSKYKYYM